MIDNFTNNDFQYFVLVKVNSEKFSKNNIIYFLKRNYLENQLFLAATCLFDFVNLLLFFLPISEMLQKQTVSKSNNCPPRFWS
jgi:hypothetical protein